ncbi:MAG: hypothetical protein RLZZ399_1683 [Verrucomicrobiota bacterium]|jgi:hypothetical protein
MKTFLYTLGCLGAAAFGYFEAIPRTHRPTAVPLTSEPHTGSPQEPPPVGSSSVPSEAESPKTLPNNWFHDVIDSHDTASEARIAVYEIIASMDPAQLLDFVKTGFTDDLTKAFRPDYVYALNRLAEIDPLAGARFLSKQTFGFATSSSFFGHWALRDPAGFADWLKEEPYSATTRNIPSSLATISKGNPDVAVAILRELGDSSHRIDGQRFMAAFLQGQTWKDGLNFLEQLPKGPVRDQALSELAATPGFPLSEHAEAREALSRLTGQAARDVGERLGGTAIELLKTGEVRAAAITSNMKKCGGEKIEITHATDFLQTLPPAERVAGIAGLVQSKAAQEAPAAVGELALRIPPEFTKERIRVLDTLLRTWVKKDAQEASRWVQSAPLSDTEYFRLTGKH